MIVLRPDINSVGNLTNLSCPYSGLHLEEFYFLTPFRELCEYPRWAHQHNSLDLEILHQNNQNKISRLYGNSQSLTTISFLLSGCFESGKDLFRLSRRVGGPTPGLTHGHHRTFHLYPRRCEWTCLEFPAYCGQQIRGNIISAGFYNFLGRHAEAVQLLCFGKWGDKPQQPKYSGLQERRV
jgi:hypothetical protein